MANYRLTVKSCTPNKEYLRAKPVSIKNIVEDYSGYHSEGVRAENICFFLREGETWDSQFYTIERLKDKEI